MPEKIVSKENPKKTGQEKIRTKKFQEKLDYYDEYLDYSNLINKLEYKFIKDE